MSAIAAQPWTPVILADDVSTPLEGGSCSDDLEHSVAVLPAAPRSWRRWAVVAVVSAALVATVGVAALRSSGFAGADPAVEGHNAMMLTGAVDVQQKYLIQTVHCQHQVCNCEWATGGALGYCASPNAPASPSSPVKDHACWSCCCSTLYPETYQFATMAGAAQPTSRFGQIVWFMFVVVLVSLAILACYVIVVYTAKARTEEAAS